MKVNRQEKIKIGKVLKFFKNIFLGTRMNRLWTDKKLNEEKDQAMENK